MSYIEQSSNDETASYEVEGRHQTMSESLEERKALAATSGDKTSDHQNQQLYEQQQGREQLDEDENDQHSERNQTGDEAFHDAESGPATRGRNKNQGNGTSYKFPAMKDYFAFGRWKGRNRESECLACHRFASSSQPERLIKHLRKCPAMTEEEKQRAEELMSEENAQTRKSTGSSRPRKSRGNDSSMFDDFNSSGDFNPDYLPKTGLKRIKRDQNDRKGSIDEALTRFIMTHRIGLKSIHSKEFIDFVRALDPDYRIPSRETITMSLIPGLLDIL